MNRSWPLEFSGEKPLYILSSEKLIKNRCIDLLDSNFICRLFSSNFVAPNNIHSSGIFFLVSKCSFFACQLDLCAQPCLTLFHGWRSRSAEPISVHARFICDVKRLYTKVIIISLTHSSQRIHINKTQSHIEWNRTSGCWSIVHHVTEAHFMACLRFR